jgi:YVTN family beta-propeller protein
MCVLFTVSCDKGLFIRPSTSSTIKHPIYALNSNSHSISIIDGERDELVGAIALPALASTFSVASNGNLVVAVIGLADLFTPYKQEIHLFSPDGKEVRESLKTKYIPDDLYLDDSHIGLVFHSLEYPGKVIPLTLIDIEKWMEIAKFEIHGFVHAVHYENNSILFYQSAPPYRGYSIGIFRINLDSMKLTEVMRLGDNQSFGRAIFHNGKLYGLRGRKGSPLPYNQTLQVIDFESKKIEKILPLSDNPHNLVFVEDRLYVTHFNDGVPSQPDHRVSIINPNTYEIEDVLDVGKGPGSICYSKSLGKVYTANFWDASVSVIDAKIRKVIKTIPTNQKFTTLIRCPE